MIITFFSEKNLFTMYSLLDHPGFVTLAGGNIFHGAMGLDSLFLMRPVKGW